MASYEGGNLANIAEAYSDIRLGGGGQNFDIRGWGRGIFSAHNLVILMVHQNGCPNPDLSQAIQEKNGQQRSVITKTLKGQSVPPFVEN